MEGIYDTKQEIKYEFILVRLMTIWFFNWTAFGKIF